MSNLLVFDIGGTHLRSAIYDKDKNIVQNITIVDTISNYDRTNTAGYQIEHELFEQIFETGKISLDNHAVDAVCIAFPGPVTGKGIVINAPTVWGKGTRNINLIEKIAPFWPDAKIHVINDVTAAGFRYLRSKNDDLCIVTVSSGIGNKLFLNGKPILGSNFRGGEIGHVRVDFSANAPVCECGGIGHLGAVASGRSTSYHLECQIADDPNGYLRSNLFLVSGGNRTLINNESLVKCFHDNDEWTTKLILRIATPLGRMLAGIHLTAGVERFVIMGGFATALGEKYRKMLVVSASESCWEHSGDWDQMIELGKNDGLDGLIGAGKFILNAV